MTLKPKPPIRKQPATPAKQATVLAVTLGISLGLCAVGQSQNVAFLVIIPFLVGGICALGLVALAMSATVNYFINKFRH